MSKRLAQICRWDFFMQLIRIEGMVTAISHLLSMKKATLRKIFTVFCRAKLTLALFHQAQFWEAEVPVFQLCVGNYCQLWNMKLTEMIL